MIFLPREAALGRLRLLEVFDYYDGPRIFSARNASGTTFFVLWADQTPELDVWLYVPVSDERLGDLRDGAIAIRDAFLLAEDGGVYLVEQQRGTGVSQARLLAVDEVPVDTLPPEGDRLTLTHATSADNTLAEAPGHDPDWLRRRALQSVWIARASGRLPPSLASVTAVLAHWRRLFEETAKSLGTRLEMVPLRAVPGSFQVDLAITDPGAADQAFRHLVSLFEGGRPPQEFAELIGSSRLPAASLRGLLEAVREGDLKIRVSMSGTTRAGQIVLGSKRADALRAPVAKSTRLHLQSQDVPQADDLGKVFRVVELCAKGRTPSVDNLAVTHRQVNYYTHAARVLGYLDESNSATPAGSQLLRLDQNEKLISSASQFETSECGASWVEWSGASSLSEVSRESASEFLLAMSDLSPTTALRRSKTLVAWLDALAPFHYRRLWRSRDVSPPNS